MRTSKKKNTYGFLCLASMVMTCVAIVMGPSIITMLGDSQGYSGGWKPGNPIKEDGGVSPTFFPEHWNGAGEGGTRLLYRDYEAVHGQPYQPREQGESPSCVGHATAAAVDFLAAVDIHYHDDMERAPPAPIAASVVYGMSRQEIGGLGPAAGGGSHNYWGARAVVEYGAVAMLRYPGLDLRTYKPWRAQKYGAYGVPTRLEIISRRHPVSGYIRIQTWEQLRDAIYAGCPVIIGSRQGFGKGQLTRDEDGFLVPPRRLFFPSVWRHSMAIIGVCDEGRLGCLILNSWGSDWVDGPKRFGDEPSGSFWADKYILERMIDHGDTWALVGFKGWVDVRIWSPQ